MSILQFDYAQSYDTHPKRRLIQIIGERDTFQKPIKPSSMKYRIGDLQFRRGRVLITGVEPSGKVKNFYLDQTYNLKSGLRPTIEFYLRKVWHKVRVWGRNRGGTE